MSALHEIRASQKGMWAKLGSILTGIETLAPVGRPSIFSHNPYLQHAGRPQLHAQPQRNKALNVPRLIWEGKIGDARAEQTPIGDGLLPLARANQNNGCWEGRAVSILPAACTFTRLNGTHREGESDARGWKGSGEKATRGANWCC